MTMGDLYLNYNSTLFMCILYVTLGTISMVCNILNLFIYFSNKNLLKKYLYFCALDFGEFVNGVSYILVGVGRGMALLGGYIDEPMTVYDCFFKRFWPHFLILGTELPGYTVLLISTERIFAVMKPALYNQIFMGKYKLLLLAIIPAAGLTSVIVGGISALGVEKTRIVKNQMCPIISSTAQWYSTYHFSAVVLIYAVSFCCLLIIKYRTRKYSTQRSKDSRIGLMLAISGSSIVLIGSASFVMLMTSWNLGTYDNVVVAITYGMPGFLSVTNTIINMTFRPELRHQLFYLLGLREKRAETTIGFLTTVSVNNGNNNNNNNRTTHAKESKTSLVPLFTTVNRKK